MNPNEPVLADLYRREAEERAWLDKLPKCDYCGEPIQEEHYYDINGDYICVECLDRNFKKEVENYV